MSSLTFESLRNFVPIRFHVPFRKSPKDDDIKNYVDQQLEQSNQTGAKNIAQTIRADRNNYPYGDMWAKRSVLIDDGRQTDLQASVDELIIDIPATQASSNCIQIRWDLKHERLREYSEWNPALRRFDFFYQTPAAIPTFPPSFCENQAAHKFSEVLQLINLH